MQHGRYLEPLLLFIECLSVKMMETDVTVTQVAFRTLVAAFT